MSLSNENNNMAHFRSVDRKTPYLLPLSLDEWLPKDHLARFVVEIVEQLDLSAMTRSYRGTGSEAYHPELLLALLIYRYCHGHVWEPAYRAGHPRVACVSQALSEGDRGAARAGPGHCARDEAAEAWQH